MATTYAFTPLSAGPGPADVWGKERIVYGTLLATGTYTITTGDAFTAAQFGMDVVDNIIMIPDGSVANTNGQALAAPDLTNMKMRLFGGAASAAAMVELANGTTTTGMQWRVIVIGV